MIHHVTTLILSLPNSEHGWRVYAKAGLTKNAFMMLHRSMLCPRIIIFADAFVCENICAAIITL